MSAEQEPNFVRSSEAARRLGVRTKTLARWRHRGVGPSGWLRLSPTMTVYPMASLAAFMEQKRATGDFEFNFRPKGVGTD